MNCFWQAERFKKSFFCLQVFLFSTLFLSFVYFNFRATYLKTRISSINAPLLRSPKGVYVLPRSEGPGTPGRLVNFPPLPHSSSWGDLIKNEGLSNAGKIGILGTAFQEQLEVFQSTSSCEGHALHCGQIDTCGLACQLHHRAACVLMSYTMGIPLIHDTTHWVSGTPWEEIYQRLGSGCKVNNKTIYVKWRQIYYAPPILYWNNCTVPAKGNIKCPLSSQFEYPLLKGLPIPNELYDIIGPLHEDPFIWYVGQFMKYTTRYNPKLEWELDQALEAIQFQKSERVVGRTDKIREFKNSHHDMSDYMNVAVKLFQKEYPQGYSPRTVFVASEDHTVLDDVESNYTAPVWKILGMDRNETFREYGDRIKSDTALRTILEDIHILSRSEHLVCGLTSNVCRLVLELMATKYPEILKRFRNIDSGHGYNFVLGWKDPPRYLLPL